MKLYNVSFFKNEVYQSNLVKTDKAPAEIDKYFKDIKKAAEVFGIDEARADDMRPGKPIIEI